MYPRMSPIDLGIWGPQPEIKRRKNSRIQERGLLTLDPHMAQSGGCTVNGVTTCVREVRISPRTFRSMAVQSLELETGKGINKICLSLFSLHRSDQKIFYKARSYVS